MQQLISAVKDALQFCIHRRTHVFLVSSSVLSGCLLDDADFVVGEAVEVVDESVDLALERRFRMARLRRGQTLGLVSVRHRRLTLGNRS